MTGLEQNKFDCLIWGGYSWGNTGDELCLAAALKRVQQQFNNHVAILSHNPEYTARLFPNVPVVPHTPPPSRRWWKRGKQFLHNCGSLLRASGRDYFRQNYHFTPNAEWARALFQSRQLYLAGGGYLSDLFPLDIFMPPIELAIRLNVPVVTAPIGIGPFQSRHWETKVASALSQMDLKVRDTISLGFCRERSIRAVLAQDDAIELVESWPSTQSAAQSADRPRKIGVCIFPQYGREKNWDGTEWWTRFLRGLKAQHPEFEIEGFCFHTSPNAEFAEMNRLFQLAGLPASRVQSPVIDFRQATVALRNYNFIISTRFHAVIAANIFNIPNVAIASGNYYLAKMNAAVKGYEAYSQLVNPHQLSPESFLAICKTKLAKRYPAARLKK